MTLTSKKYDQFYLSDFLKTFLKRRLCDGAPPNVCQCSGKGGKSSEESFEDDLEDDLEFDGSFENDLESATSTDEIVFPPFANCSDVDRCRPGSCLCDDGRNVSVVVEYFNRLVCPPPTSRSDCTCISGDQDVVLTTFLDLDAVKECRPFKCGCSDGTQVYVKARKGRKRGKKGRKGPKGN